MNTPSSRPGPFARLLNRYLDLSFAHPVPFLLFYLALMGLAVFTALRLYRIDTDLRVLLPENTPSVVALKESEARMGSTDLFTIAFQAPDAEAVARLQKALADSVSKWDDVVWVQYDQSRAFFESRALLYLPTDQLADLRDRLNGMIGEGFAEANPFVESLFDEEPAAPGAGSGSSSLEGWPDTNALRRQGLPRDLTDALLAQIRGSSKTGSAAAGASGTGSSETGLSEAGASGTGAGKTPAATAPGEAASAAPPLPDSLTGRNMAWHEEKKMWVGVVLAQLKKPSTDAVYAKGVYDRGESLIASLAPSSFHPQMEARVAGAYRNFSEIDQVGADARFAGTLSFLLIVGILYLFLRRAVNVILVVIPLLIATAWTAAFAFLIFGRLTLLTAFILSLVMGLGIEYGIHLYSRWAEERRRGLTSLDAMRRAIHITGRSLLSGAATNIFAMLSLQVGHFTGFKEFGVVVSLGIALCLLSSWLVIPPLFFLLTRLGTRLDNSLARRPGKPGLLAVLARRMLPGETEVQGGQLLPRIPFTPRLVRALGIGALVASLLLLFAPGAGFENDFRNLRGKSTGAGISYGRAVGGGKNTSPSIILGQSEAQMRSVHDSLAARHGAPADSMMKSFATIQSFVPSPVQMSERLALLAEIRSILAVKALEKVDAETKEKLDLLRRYAGPDSFGFDSIPAWTRRYLTEADGSHGRIGYLYGNLRESDAVESGKFQERFGTVPSATGPVLVASSGFIYADVVRMVKHDGMYLAIATLVLLMVITWLDMRSFRGMAIALGFILLSAFWTYKLMGLFGLKLGMFNLVVLPTILSVSIDSVIHMYHRRMELGAGRLGELVQMTGSSVLVGTLTNAFGFAGLCFVEHRGMQTIGFLACLGIGCGLLVMFTALLWALETFCPKAPVAGLG